MPPSSMRPSTISNCNSRTGASPLPPPVPADAVSRRRVCQAVPDQDPVHHHPRRRDQGGPAVTDPVPDHRDPGGLDVHPGVVVRLEPRGRWPSSPGRPATTSAKSDCGSSDGGAPPRPVSSTSSDRENAIPRRYRCGSSSADQDRELAEHPRRTIGVAVQRLAHPGPGPPRRQVARRARQTQSGGRGAAAPAASGSAPGRSRDACSPARGRPLVPHLTRPTLPPSRNVNALPPGPPQSASRPASTRSPSPASTCR